MASAKARRDKVNIPDEYLEPIGNNTGMMSRIPGFEYNDKRNKKGAKFGTEISYK